MQSNAWLAQGGPEKGRRVLSCPPSITRFGAIGQLNRHDTGQTPRSMRVIYPGSQYAQFASNGSRGTSARPSVPSAALSIDISNSLALPKRHQHFDCCGDAPRRSRFGTVLLSIIGQNVGYEDFCWITGSGVARPDMEEVREGGFSKSAFRSAR